MSDCGVCIYSGYEGARSDFFHDEKRIARKPHKCCECGRLIEKGQSYIYASGKSDGSVWSRKSCLICDEIADAFCCDGRTYGSLWDGMNEVFEELTTSCFDRLKTPGAKSELQRRWMKWKGLTA